MLRKGPEKCKPLCASTGLCAEEVHLCGESAAIDLVTELLYTTGEEVEVRDVPLSSGAVAQS